MLYFLDLDGVIIDSAEECYEVSMKVFYDKDKKRSSKYKKKFLENRGLVLNAGEYHLLHESLNLFFKDKIKSIKKYFEDKSGKLNFKTIKEFEKNFFLERKFLIRNNFDFWINLNPLTKFGEFIISKKLKRVCIITSKNKFASKKILDFYGIKFEYLFGAEDIKSYQTKGNIIKSVLDNNKISNSIFIDDSVRNLDTCVDQRVKCYFAGWGYGVNTNYDEYSF